MTKTYQEALFWASSLLEQNHIDPDGARYVLEHRAGFTPSQLRLNRQERVPQAVWAQFQQDVEALLTHQPPQYLVGVAPFFGADFIVNSAVLIPRFETEELVAWAVADQQEARSGLDLATGSGVIGITLARQLQAVMTLSDLSPEALAVARQNAARLAPQVTLVQSDLLAAFEQRFDFIIANLPYISRREVAVMDQSTLQYEPALALFAEEDGLALFRRLLPALPKHLRPGGAVYLEFGYRQQPALAALIKQLLPQAQAEFRRDMAGQPRLVKVTL